MSLQRVCLAVYERSLAVILLDFTVRTLDQSLLGSHTPGIRGNP